MRYKYTDYHVHTNWSIDIKDNGPSFEDYIQIAELNRINICFLEHYELRYMADQFSNPFSNENINTYLEELDILKETYDFILAGLEVDYYEEKETELREFMDDYGKELDFIAGTVHEWIPFYPITSRAKLVDLLEKKSMKDVIAEYFVASQKMVESKIFKNVCHIDTIFRYINENDIKPEDDCDVSNKKVLELGRLCIKNKLTIEYNLSGTRFPINRPFPSREVARILKDEGVKFFIGSDSHSLDYFEDQIPKIKKAYHLLKGK
ncbi:MAG: histidinol-phosphatase HisJ family protein [Promethearchaeota archaeon]|nr:MAG: histidinol-phosphatase HisJ family protein [Candidatus Lokiarchaeota archaeon]